MGLFDVLMLANMIDMIDMIFDRYIYISWKYEKCQIYYQPPAKSLQMSQALKTIYLGRPQVDTGFLIIQLQPAMFT